MKKIVFILLLTIMLTGCGASSIKVNNPLKESNIKSFVENDIYKKTGDKVIVNIKSQEDLYVCTAWFDGCVYNQQVDNGKKYNLEITKDEVKATGTYSDGYILYGSDYNNGKKIVEATYNTNYNESKGLDLVRNEFVKLLDANFNNYYIYKDISNECGYDIFINSDNYELLNELFIKFNKIVNNYRDYAYTSFSVYIYKDTDIFNSTIFELYKTNKEQYSGQSYGKDMIEQYTTKEVTRIGNSTGFNKELFESNGSSNKSNEYVDYSTFDYLVFWYHSEPNASSENGSLQIFGVK